MRDLVSPSMAILALLLLDTLPKQINDTLALSLKVGTTLNDLLLEISAV
jgi:hypothetical protein